MGRCFLDNWIVSRVVFIVVFLSFPVRPVGLAMRPLDGILFRFHCSVWDVFRGFLVVRNDLPDVYHLSVSLALHFDISCLGEYSCNGIRTQCWPF